MIHFKNDVKQNVDFQKRWWVKEKQCWVVKKMSKKKSVDFKNDDDGRWWAVFFQHTGPKSEKVHFFWQNPEFLAEIQFYKYK